MTKRGDLSKVSKGLKRVHPEHRQAPLVVSRGFLLGFCQLTDEEIDRMVLEGKLHECEQAYIPDEDWMRSRLAELDEGD